MSLNGVSWNYYNKFNDVTDKYLPPTGEGNTVAEQIVTAVNKLIYKGYNDGDVYDNMHALEGWGNDLSSYANWLYDVVGAKVLKNIEYCRSEAEYEYLLQELADEYLDEELLKDYAKMEKIGSIYNHDGIFRFEEYSKEEW